MNSNCKSWLEGEATCQDAWGVPLRSAVCWAVPLAPLAPLGRDEPDRTCHTGLPGDMSHRVQDSSAFFHGVLLPEQQLVCANLVALLQVLPTPPAAPPCTRSAPSAASTWWASARSLTACTSAPTPSPARTSGTRPWPSPAAAPTPVSSTPAPFPQLQQVGRVVQVTGQS